MDDPWNALKLCRREGKQEQCPLDFQSEHYLLLQLASSDIVFIHEIYNKRLLIVLEKRGYT